MIRNAPIVSTLTALGLLALPWGVAAQPAERVAQEADALYFAGSTQASYELLREHLGEQPEDYDALWRAARAGFVLGDAIEEGIYLQNDYLDPAIVFGDRAVAARPDGVEGLYWRGVAAGRRALNAGNDYASELADRVFADANAVLELDPLHGGAHNLLGKMYFEFMSLSWWERPVARMLAGSEAMKNASWEDAEFHLERASGLWPTSVRMQFDVVELYKKRRDDDDVREAIERLLTLPALHPSDERMQATAELYLQELDD